MKADIYIELPGVAGTLPRLARRRGDQLEPLDAAGFVAQGRPKVVAFASALAIARFRVTVTARSEQEAKQTALYAIEDDLAQPVEDVHVVLGPRLREGHDRDVYVVDKRLLASWFDYLQSAQMTPADIVPESSLPLPENTVLDFGDRLLLNGTRGPVAADAGWPEDAKLALIHASGLDGASIRPAHALQTLAALHAKSPGVSLAGTGTGYVRSGARSWLAAGALAAVAAAIWMGSVWMETDRLQQAVSRQDDALRAQYRALFPGAPEPADIHAEVRRLAQRLAPAAGNEFRQLSSVLYAAIAGSDTIRLARLSYAEGEPALHANLEFAGRADEAAFTSRLEAEGLNVTTTSVRDLANGVEASLIVRAGP